ncbi:hypothetical protein L198_04746 [Cryptococcus wingfieldii CBS 7118]|uniref:Uncharacterized protein n=1 Tax=Cryptococcus wingfieldii CBS 7118 TaxID=1295528 RepID=A0A1E3J3B3_9TREE|nr:hypothetical protein L198_04746 [Cryptococcus wingfieldii CBS 7118]ODN95350.1 hypothetical protein L198_04746 [Cryptococcus wingfieldii CBS 7118]
MDTEPEASAEPAPEGMEGEEGGDDERGFPTSTPPPPGAFVIPVQNPPSPSPPTPPLPDPDPYFNRDQCVPILPPRIPHLPPSHLATLKPKQMQASDFVDSGATARALAQLIPQALADTDTLGERASWNGGAARALVDIIARGVGQGLSGVGEAEGVHRTQHPASGPQPLLLPGAVACVLEDHMVAPIREPYRHASFFSPDRDTGRQVGKAERSGTGEKFDLQCQYQSPWNAFCVRGRRWIGYEGVEGIDLGSGYRKSLNSTIAAMGAISSALTI